MKWRFAIYAGIFIALTLTACTKDKNNNQSEPPPPLMPVNDTTDYIVIGCDTMTLGAGTNYIRSYNFSNETATGNFKELGNFHLSDTGKFKIKFLHATNLFHPNAISEISDYYHAFDLPNALKGKPLFEVYIDSFLVKRFIAASGSFSLVVFSHRGVLKTFSTKEVCDEFNELMKPKQVSNLLYNGKLN